MYTALLDSCVLWPSLQRDFLLSLAAEGAYRFVFSESTLSEVETNEELKLIDRGRDLDGSRADALHLSSRMRESFADSIVYGWEGLEGTYGLPDPDDEHVLAAAVVGGAGCIVTENMRDFPLDNIPEGLQIIGAVDFAHETVSMRPDLGAAAVTAWAQRSGRKYAAMSEADFLDELDRRYELNAATAIVRNYFDSK